jgi:hypothetical protein
LDTRRLCFRGSAKTKMGHDVLKPTNRPAAIRPRRNHDPKAGYRERQ